MGASQILICTHGCTHDAPICTHGAHRINSSILRNERYKGDARLQKSFCTDYLTKKFKKNEGEVPQYNVRNSHPAIVSPEVWELVQIEIEDRKTHGNRYSGKGAFASKVICGECGCFFGAKVWHSTDPYRTVIWRCSSSAGSTA